MNIIILQKLIRILNRQFLIPIQNLNGRYNFYKDLQLNYLEQMEMLFYVEKEFKIDIEDREVNNLLTVNDLVFCIESHLDRSKQRESQFQFNGNHSFAQLKDVPLFV